MLFRSGIQILNNDLNVVLKNIQNTINKKEITETMNKEEIYMKLIKNIQEGGLGLASVHAEVILSNQIRDAENIYEKPDWSIPNVPYKIKALNKALMDNPSIAVTLSYQRTSQALYNPSTFKKTKPSVLDLFFMEQPQNYLNDNYDNEPKKMDEFTSDGKQIVYKRIEDKDKLKKVYKRINKK